MANESHSPSSSAKAEPAALLAPETARDSPHDKTSPKGSLRAATHRVREGIEHNEREAKKHRKRAAELRRDLRESFAFVQDKKSDARPARTEESKPAEPIAKAKAKDTPADDKAQKASAKKKPAAGKSR